MLIKQITLIVVGLILSISLNAQESTQSFNAFGINFKQPNNLSFLYKKQIAPNTYRRLNILFFRAAVAGNSFNQSAQGSAGFSIAKEQHQAINNKLSFYKGLEYGASANLSSIFGERNDYNIALNLGYLLGLEYRFPQKIALQLELIPRVSVLYSRSGSSEGYWRGNANLNTTNIGFNVIYYFMQQKTSQT